MSQVIEKDAASSLLQPYLPLFNSIMVDSLNQLNNALNAIDVNINNRAKTATLHSIAVEKTKRSLNESDGLRIFQKYKSIQIVVEGRIVGRIKKLKRNNLTSNSKTFRNSLIESQQLRLFNLPEMTFVDLGYHIDPTWTSYEKLLVICRVNDEIKWELPFDDDAFDITLTTQPIEVKPIKPETFIKIRKSDG